MKTKKTNRPFRCTDTLYKLVETAANEAEMSVNEWILSAIRTQLKEGIHGDGLSEDQVEAVGELAKAEAITTTVTSLNKAIEKTESIFRKNHKELAKALAIAEAYSDQLKKNK